MTIYTGLVASAPEGTKCPVSRTPFTAQASLPRRQPGSRTHGPADDAAAPPHQGDAAVVEGPAEFGGRLSQQHEALSVRDDLGGIEGLEDTGIRAAISKAAACWPSPEQRRPQDQLD